MHNLQQSTLRFDIPHEHRNASGIYAIKNLVNGKVYVGSAMKLVQRYRDHVKHIRANKHHSKKLQRSIAKYGFENFHFLLLEVCEKSNLISREQYWLDSLSAVKNGYNNSPTAGNCLGVKYSDEVRKKMSETRKGREVWNAGKKGLYNLSEEARKKISEFHKGKKWMLGKKASEETRAKLSVQRKGNKYALGLKHTEEAKKKISDAIKGEKHPNFGKPQSEKAKQVMKGNNFGTLRTAASRERLRIRMSGENNPLFGKHHSDEVKAKISKTKTGRPNLHASKAVLQLTMSGELINKFLSQHEAARQGFKQQGISAVCTGAQKSHRGFVWRYAA